MPSRANFWDSGFRLVRGCSLDCQRQMVLLAAAMDDDSDEVRILAFLLAAEAPKIWAHAYVTKCSKHGDVVEKSRIDQTLTGIGKKCYFVFISKSLVELCVKTLPILFSAAVTFVHGADGCAIPSCRCPRCDPGQLCFATGNLWCQSASCLQDGRCTGTGERA